MSEKKAPADLFPERLRSARKLRGMEQADLGKVAELPSTSISHFEGGSRKPSFDNLRRLSQALNVTTDYLLGRAETPTMSMQADPLYRHMQNLTDDDRNLTQEFMQMLAKRRNKKNEDKG